MRGEEPLSWSGFIDNYLAMYPEGIPELQPKSNLSMASLASPLPKLTTALPPISRPGQHGKGRPIRDPAQECFACLTPEEVAQDTASPSRQPALSAPPRAVAKGDARKERL